MTMMQQPRLIDNFGRHIHYLRLSLTDRCNLRCNYCMADTMDFIQRDNTLTDDEVIQVAEAFVGLGIDKIRLTGGEPLIRPNIINIVQGLRSLKGLKTLALSTNGVLLKEMASELAAAGIDEINISLDTLEPQRFKEITRVGQLESVLAGIEVALQAGFSKVKLNTVAMQGVNHDELVELSRFAVKNQINISFIEEMPLGNITSHERSETAHQSSDAFANINAALDLKACNYHTSGPSRYYQVANSTAKIGFISPMSDNFCDSCNRVRLTAEGRLLLCLGHEDGVDLRHLLRQSDITQQQLQLAIKQALPLKPARHYFDQDVQPLRFMNMTGG